MPSQVKPLSAVSGEFVTAYLLSKGVSADVIRWKYFGTMADDSERGLVYVHNDAIVAFLGLIPFTVIDAGRAIKTAWSCDWFKEPNAPGLAAIMLVKESLRYYPRIYSFGGNAVTRLLFSKLATASILEAGITLHKALRLGGILKPLARKTGLRLIESIKPLNFIPLTGLRHFRKADVTICSTLSRDVPGLSDSFLGLNCYPCYDRDYISWQLERCPAVHSGICIPSDSGRSNVVLCFWRSSLGNDFWRIAIFAAPSALDAIDDALAAVLNHIYSLGGSLVSVLVSHLEHDLCRLLERFGFVKSRARRPLYVLSADPLDPVNELERLSFLDTDWAYRFPLVTDAYTGST